MGEIVPARTSPTLLPPSPRTVLSLSCFKVLQCIPGSAVHPRELVNLPCATIGMEYQVIYLDTHIYPYSMLTS